MKKLLGLLLVSVFLVSCGGNKTTEQTADKAVEETKEVVDEAGASQAKFAEGQDAWVAGMIENLGLDEATKTKVLEVKDSFRDSFYAVTDEKSLADTKAKFAEAIKAVIPADKQEAFDAFVNQK